MDITFDQYLEVYNGVVNQPPFCFLARNSAGEETVRLLTEQGKDPVQLANHLETHRLQVGKLWHYTGD